MKLLQVNTGRPAGGATPPTAQQPATPAPAPRSGRSTTASVLLNVGVGSGQTSPGNIGFVSVQPSLLFLANIPAGRNGTIFLGAGPFARFTRATSSTQGLWDTTTVGARVLAGYEHALPANLALRLNVGVDLGAVVEGQGTAGGVRGYTSFPGDVAGPVYTPFIGAGVAWGVGRAQVGLGYEGQTFGNSGERTLPSLTQADATTTENIGTTVHGGTVSVEVGLGASNLQEVQRASFEIATILQRASSAFPSGAPRPADMSALRALLTASPAPTQDQIRAAFNRIIPPSASNGNRTYDELVRAAQLLNSSAMSESSIGVRGHTDSTRPSARGRTNEAISQDRADVIGIVLRLNGVESGRVAAWGVGATAPVYDVDRTSGIRGAYRDALRTAGWRGRGTTVAGFAQFSNRESDVVICFGNSSDHPLCQEVQSRLTPAATAPAAAPAAAAPAAPAAPAAGQNPPAARRPPGGALQQ